MNVSLFLLLFLYIITIIPSKKHLTYTSFQITYLFNWHFRETLSYFVLYSFRFDLSTCFLYNLLSFFLKPSELVDNLTNHPFIPLCISTFFLSENALFTAILICRYLSYKSQNLFQDQYHHVCKHSKISAKKFFSLMVF